MIGQLISVSGPIGSGKSTISRYLATSLGAQLVEYDQFEQMTRKLPEDVARWLASGADYAQIPAPGLEAAVRDALMNGDVIFDTPLGRADPVLGPRIDVSIWLDCAADISLARKMQQLASSVPEGQEAGFANWARAYLAAYPKIVAPAQFVQRKKVAPAASLRVDAEAPLDKIQADIMERLAALR